jgi:hypothetical protein
MPKRVPMASIDAAWLGIEDPTNLMVTGVLALAGPAHRRGLQARVRGLAQSRC